MVLADILRLDITYLDRIAGRSELTELYRRRQGRADTMPLTN